jgi:hypothetical protein
MRACLAVDNASSPLDGVFTLERVDGPANVQGVGSVVFTRQGYAERRIRYREADSSLSREWLSRGQAERRQDGTIAVEFVDIDPRGVNPWHPEVRLTRDGIELVRYGAADYTRIVETYRRQ